MSLGGFTRYGLVDIPLLEYGSQRAVRVWLWRSVAAFSMHRNTFHFHCR